ncbi:15785_t:CDS:1, partial [Dentiscutata erythropus]
LEVEDTITSAEPFSGEMLSPKKIDVGLPNDIYNTLVEYYNNAYNTEFLSITESVQRNIDDNIIVQPQ